MAMRAPDSANETTTLVQLHAQRSQGVPADDPMDGAIQRAIKAFAGRLDESECLLNGDVSWFANAVFLLLLAGEGGGTGFLGVVESD